MGPFAKVFLGAIFTYQVIHWTWLKLEMDESKLEKNGESVSLLFVIHQHVAKVLQRKWLC